MPIVKFTHDTVSKGSSILFIDHFPLCLSYIKEKQIRRLIVDSETVTDVCENEEDSKLLNETQLSCQGASIQR